MTVEQIVQAQLDHYNNHELEAFVELFHVDIKVYDLAKNTLRFEGRDDFRERYRNRFADGTVHAKLVNRMVIGNQVIDHEHVTTGDSDQVKQAVAIYEVIGEIITKVWFLYD